VAADSKACASVRSSRWPPDPWPFSEYRGQTEVPLMDRRTFLRMLAAGLLAAPLVPEAQQATKVTPIGYLSGPSLSANAARMEAFGRGRRELSSGEGKNIVIEWRSTDGNLDRPPALAAELVRLKGAVIVTSGGAPTRRAKEATSTNPIVMTNDP